MAADGSLKRLHVRMESWYNVGMAARGKNAVAVFSVAMLALLACGLVGRVGVDIQYIAGSGTQALYQEREVSLENGRLQCFSTSSSAIPRGFANGLHLRPFIQFWPIRLPDVRKMIFGFDAHSLPGMPKGQKLFLLSCPIWFAALPFLIAPVVWLRKRRRAEAPRFAVIVGDEKSL